MISQFPHTITILEGFLNRILPEKGEALIKELIQDKAKENQVQLTAKNDTVFLST
jgi:hypothetical protein